MTNSIKDSALAYQKIEEFLNKNATIKRPYSLKDIFEILHEYVSSEQQVYDCIRSLRRRSGSKVKQIKERGRMFYFVCDETPVQGQPAQVEERRTKAAPTVLVPPSTKVKPVINVDGDKITIETEHFVIQINPKN